MVKRLKPSPNRWGAKQIAIQAAKTATTKALVDHGFSKATGGKYGREFTWENYLTSFATSAATTAISSKFEASKGADAFEIAGKRLGNQVANGLVSDAIRRNTYGSYDADKETGLNFLERTLQSTATSFANDLGEATAKSSLQFYYGEEAGAKRYDNIKAQQKLDAQKPDWIDSTLDFLGIVDLPAHTQPPKNALAAEQRDTEKLSAIAEQERNESLGKNTELLNLGNALAAIGDDPGSMSDVAVLGRQGLFGGETTQGALEAEAHLEGAIANALGLETGKQTSPFDSGFTDPAEFDKFGRENFEDYSKGISGNPLDFEGFKVEANDNQSEQVAQGRAAQQEAAGNYQNALDNYSELQNLNQLVNSGKATADQKLAYHNALTGAAGTSKAAKDLADNLSSAPESLGVHVTGSRTKAAYKDVLKNLGSNITTSQESIRTATRELKVDLMSPAERTQTVSSLLDKGLRHDGKGYVTNASREEVRLTQTILNKEGYGVHDTKGKIQPLTVDGGFGRIPSKNSAFSSSTAKSAGHFAYRDMIEKYAEKEGLSPAFVSSIADRESGFNINAKSDTQVYGLFQITQATAEEMGIFQSEKNRGQYMVDGVGPLLDGRSSVEFSSKAGAGYLSKQVKRFANDTANDLENLKFAASGYNKGPGATNTLIAKQFGNNSSSFGQKNIYWDNLINGVKDSRGKQVGPVVIKDAKLTKEVYGYVNNIFYSDHDSKVNNGGRYNYYQQFYKNRD